MSHPLPKGVDRPRILLDALPLGMRLDVWRRQADPSHPDYPWATARLADLIRVFDPERALQLADEAEELGAQPAQVAAVRAAAHLEQNRPDEARTQLPLLADGALREFFRARLLLLEGNQVEGLVVLDGLLDRPELAPDLRGEALSFRSRAHPEDGVEGMLADLKRLESLCVEHEANLTGIWLGLFRALVKSEGWEAAARCFTAVDLAQQLVALTEGLQLDPASLGPIPVHVHAIFLRHRNEPRKAVQKLIQITGLLWKSGLHAQAHKTAVYGRRIGTRLLDPQGVWDLTEYEGVLRRHAGEKRWRELSAALEEEEHASREAE